MCVWRGERVYKGMGVGGYEGMVVGVMVVRREVTQCILSVDSH